MFMYVYIYIYLIVIITIIIICNKQENHLAVFWARGSRWDLQGPGVHGAQLPLPLRGLGVGLRAAGALGLQPLG